MAVRKITKAIVDTLRPGEVVWDQNPRGFGVRRQTAKGAPVFVLKARASGRQIFMTIGPHGSPWTVEKARERAKRLIGAIADGKDPAGERDAAKGVPTVQELAEWFLAEHVEKKKKPRTAAEYRRILNTRVLPRLGKLRADAVRSADVGRLHGEMSGTPREANNMLAVVSSMYGRPAVKAGKIPKGLNPTDGVERFAENERARFLNTKEFGRLAGALREAETVGLPWEGNSKHAPKLPENRVSRIDPHAAAAIRLLLLTGCRLREILNLRWENVDLEGGMLNLPTSKTGAKVVILNAAAIAVLSRIERVGAFVIAGRAAGTKSEKPRSDLQRPWAAVSRRAGLAGVRIHDLRHSFASIGASGRHGLPIIGKLLGHTQAKTTQRYAHLDDDPLRRATDAIGAAIASAMGEGADAP